MESLVKINLTLKFSSALQNILVCCSTLFGFTAYDFTVLIHSHHSHHPHFQQQQCFTEKSHLLSTNSADKVRDQRIRLLSYGKNHNHDYFGQYWDHNDLTQLLTDSANNMHLLDIFKCVLF